MATVRICQKCRQPVSAFAPAGLCANCLLESGSAGPPDQSGLPTQAVAPSPSPVGQGEGEVEGPPQNSELTLTGQVLGTPNYMPPEQARGRRGEIGPHSDVYSLGGILFYLFTGRAPFVAETLEETLQQVLTREPLSPRLLIPALPRDLETICLKCLAKEPARRYGSAAELAEDLGRWLRHEPIHAKPAGTFARVCKVAGKK
jgi:serine/threonine protein kinase